MKKKKKTKATTKFIPREDILKAILFWETLAPYRAENHINGLRKMLKNSIG
jgi:hypothetical protein